MSIAGFLKSVVLLISCAFSAGLMAQSSGWKPEKHVEVIVPFTPGPLDHAARTMQSLWTTNKWVNVTSTVTNKAGGGGALGWLYLDQHAKDPHFVAIGSPTMLTSNIIGTGTANYTDFTPLSMILTEYTVAAVRVDSPIKTGADLINRLKADPQSVSFSVGSAIGSANHIVLAQIARSVGLDSRKLKAVAFTSAGAGMTALMGGHVDVAVSSLGGFVPQVEAGKLRLIAVTAGQRLPGLLSNVPTWKEQNVPIESGSWRVMYGPKGITEEQVRFWENVYLQLSKDAEWQTMARSRYLDPVYKGSRDTRAHLDAEYGRLKAALTDLGMVK